MKARTLTLLAVVNLLIFFACKKEDKVLPNCSLQEKETNSKNFYILGKFGNEEIDIKTSPDAYKIKKNFVSADLQYKDNCFIHRSSSFVKPHPTDKFPAMTIELNHAYPSSSRTNCAASFEDLQTIVNKLSNKFSSGIFITKDHISYQGAHFTYLDKNGKSWKSGPGYLQKGTFLIEEVKVGSVEKEELIVTFKVKCELFNHTDTKVLKVSGKYPLYNKAN